ncbi:MAG: hypothetical protein ACREOF_11100 [Gemmatimonadales bacterium]
MAPFPPADAFDSGDRSRSMVDEVRDRVTAAEAALALAPTIPGRTRPARALWRVFHDLGTTSRQRRRETGAPPVPAVRDAAHAFRRAPNLPNLLAVATLLNQHGLLSRSA